MCAGWRDSNPRPAKDAIQSLLQQPNAQVVTRESGV
jgi:hypothetical protein